MSSPTDLKTPRSVIITGGTSGLGKALGLAFTKAGDNVFLTYSWGTADENALLEEYKQQGLPLPTLVCADTAETESTQELMQVIKDKKHEKADIIINNVSFAQVVHNIDELSRPALHLTLNYSAWPIVDYVQTAKKFFGQYPKYVIGISSDAAEICHPGYALSGCSKAVLETLIRYLSSFLSAQGTCVNGIRPGFMDTRSSRASLGDKLVDTINTSHIPLLAPGAVANVAVALCSGLMDAVNGEIITVDGGAAHYSFANFFA